MGWTSQVNSCVPGDSIASRTLSGSSWCSEITQKSNCGHRGHLQGPILQHICMMTIIIYHNISCKFISLVDYQFVWFFHFRSRTTWHISWHINPCCPGNWWAARARAKKMRPPWRVWRVVSVAWHFSGHRTVFLCASSRECCKWTITIEY